MNWAGGVATAAKANITPIVLTKRVDAASPLLFINNLLGTKVPKAVLTFRKTVGIPLEFITITLSDVFISKYEFGGSTDSEQPTESVSLSFKTIAYRFVPQKPDGSAGAPIEKKFDVIANKAL
jgi:type VI secretion system secreted protein Hcp